MVVKHFTSRIYVCKLFLEMKFAKQRSFIELFNKEVREIIFYSSSLFDFHSRINFKIVYDTCVLNLICAS